MRPPRWLLESPIQGQCVEHSPEDALTPGKAVRAEATRGVGRGGGQDGGGQAWRGHPALRPWPQPRAEGSPCPPPIPPFSRGPKRTRKRSFQGTGVPSIPTFLSRRSQRPFKATDAPAGISIILIILTLLFSR